MLKRRNLHHLLVTMILMLTTSFLIGQSFYKTYNQRVPAYPYDIFPNGNGYKIYSGDSDFASVTRNYYQVDTDENGNLSANQSHNLGAYSNRAITYRTNAGLYVFMDANNNAGRMVVSFVRPNGTLARSTNLSFTAGHTAVAGAATQYSNGDVLVTYYHGAAWTNPFDVPQRRIRWARVRPSTGAIISQGSMLARRVDQFQAEAEINAVAVSPNGSIFIANIEDTPISERHYLTKINPNGTEAWFFETATLERGIFRLEASSDNAALYNHTQSREGVHKVNGANNFIWIKNTDGIFRKNMARELIVPTNDGGAFIIAHDIASTGGFLRPSQIHTARINSNGDVVAQNIITQAGTSGSHMRPTAGLINSAGELVVTGWEDPTPDSAFGDAFPFLLKLGSNGQWVQGGGGNGVDLEMRANSTKPNPGVWETTDLTFTLRNTGSQTATNVQVKVDIPGTIILQGGNEYQASQGSFSPYGNKIWNVGTVAAGSTKTLKLNFYNPNTNAKNVFAQVQSASGNDGDSTPGNGSCCNGLEDDEAFIAFNSGAVPTRFPDLTGSDVRIARTSATLGQVVNYSFDLSNIGDVSVSGNYRISARLSRSNTNPFFGEEAGVVNTGNTALGTTQDVPGAITVPNNLPVGTYYLWVLVDNEFDIRESNENNNRIVSSSTINITAGGGGGQPDFVINNLIFDTRTTFDFGESLRFNYQSSNNGAAYTGGILTRLYLSTDNNLNTGDIAIGQQTSGASGGFIQASIPSDRPAGQYYVIARIDDRNAIAESNENNNVFVGRRITIRNPVGGGGAIDVNMTASPTNPNQWAFFAVTVTARNTGSSAASNVRVKLTTPSAITYRGGNEFSASKGTLDWWNSETWNIGSLNAGQTATLTVNFFRLSANGFTVSSNVTSGGGNDSASVNFGSAANGVNNRSAVLNNMQNEPFAIVNAYPNPTTEHITVGVYSNKAQTSDLEIISLTGKRVFGNSYDLQEGLNEIKIETAQFQSGQYFIKMNPFHPYLRKIDFTKVK